MQLFYSNNIQGNTIVLDETESRHCIQVLRKKTLDTINVIDGLGNLYTAQIIQDNKKSCTAQIQSQQHFAASKPIIEVFVAPTKNADKLDWLIEKLTEIGVQKISFIKTQLTEKFKLNHERLTRLSISACKQSCNYWLPKINEIQNYDAVITSLNKEASQNIIFHNLIEQTLPLNKVLQADRQIYNLFIGPEGGFTAQEIDAALANEIEVALLGNNRLRVETAAIVACGFVKNFY